MSKMYKTYPYKHTHENLAKVKGSNSKWEKKRGYKKLGEIREKKLKQKGERS